MAAARGIARAVVIAGIAACIGLPAAGAREYPDKPVRVIVAFAAATVTASAQGGAHPASATVRGTEW